VQQLRGNWEAARDALHTAMTFDIQPSRRSKYKWFDIFPTLPDILTGSVLRFADAYALPARFA
jgi:hypothetical protein